MPERIKLSPAQLDLLRTLAGYDHHHGFIRPSGRRTADAPRRLGLIRGDWIGRSAAGATVTANGLAHLRSLDSEAPADSQGEGR